MTVKKTTTVLLLAVGLGFLCYFAIKTFQKVAKTAAEQTATMPDFAIKNKEGNVFSKRSLEKNTPSVFIAFHPECEHCQYEAKSINDKQKELANTNIILFTSANDSLIHAFSKTYGLDSLKNVHILNDSTNTMRQLFAIKSMPTVIIYNAQNQLVKRFNGETKIDAILKYTQMGN